MSAIKRFLEDQIEILSELSGYSYCVVMDAWNKWNEYDIGDFDEFRDFVLGDSDEEILMSLKILFLEVFNDNRRYS